MEIDAHAPQHEMLLDEMLGCVRTGVSIRFLLRCPGILRLAIVGAKAASAEPQDLASAAYGLIRETVVSIDGGPHGPTALLLGLAPGTRGTLLKERRRLIADQLCISVDHLRTSGREPALVEVLVDELLALDSAYRVRHQHRIEREREPVDSRLKIDWLARHEAYRRVWTPVAAMRDDVAVLLEYVNDEAADRAALGDRLVTISWRYAQFQTGLEQFMREYGGLWLLSDVDTEFALAETVTAVHRLVPMGTADDSWLRLLLAKATHGELDSFEDLLLADERRTPLIRAWNDWAQECSCLTQASGHSPGGCCRPHAWIAAADGVTTILDADWIAIADWYRGDGRSAFGG